MVAQDVFGGRYTATGYHSARQLRESGLAPAGGTADSHLRYDRELLVNQSRAFDRDNWLYETALNRGADYILGPTGFGLQAQTGIDGVNAKIEQELWPRFCEAPEVRRVWDWAPNQELCLRELWVAGDTLWLKLGEAAGEDAGLLQHVESERIASTENSDGAGNLIEQGVKLNRKGQISGFRIADVDRRTGWVRAGQGR